MIPVVPCVEYEIVVIAELFNNEKLDTEMVNFKSRDQPALVANAVAHVKMVDADDLTSVDITGNIDDILKDEDCKSAKTLLILYKTEDKEEFTQEEVSLHDGEFYKHLFLPEYCKKYLFKIQIEGFPGTNSVSFDIPQTVGPIDVEENGAENVPTVTDLTVSPDAHSALIKWRQPDCVPEYEVVVFLLEDCPEEDIFTDCFEESTENKDVETVKLKEVVQGFYRHGSEYQHKITNLQACTNYLILARTSSRFGKGKISHEKFRTRSAALSPDSQPEWSLAPPPPEVAVVPGVNAAQLVWSQPECFPGYELQVVRVEDCKDSSQNNCKDEFSAAVTGTAEKESQVHNITNLSPCTLYAAMSRTIGKILPN